MRRIQGKLTWLELNTQRSPDGQEFYRDLFCWEVAQLHVSPWGILPVLKNGKRAVGHVFLAMDSFVPSQWFVHLSADIDECAKRALKAGGSTGDRNPIEGFATLCGLKDPQGTDVTLIERADGDDEGSQPGDAFTAELWAPDADAVVSFYEETFDLIARKTERGWALMKDGEARFFVRTNSLRVRDFPPRWIPYFGSLAVRADQRRAQMLGAVQQVEFEEAPGIG
ncbi:MAG: hypothetical protein K8F91_02475, partial [Candidatus Obscuribacterales bacterium]|nr:hypothetical protein [Candidatus Obscuribacterales bacterium]